MYLKWQICTSQRFRTLTCSADAGVTAELCDNRSLVISNNMKIIPRSGSVPTTNWLHQSAVVDVLRPRLQEGLSTAVLTCNPVWLPFSHQLNSTTLRPSVKTAWDSGSLDKVGRMTLASELRSRWEGHSCRSARCLWAVHSVVDQKRS